MSIRLALNLTVKLLHGRPPDASACSHCVMAKNYGKKKVMSVSGSRLIITDIIYCSPVAFVPRCSLKNKLFVVIKEISKINGIFSEARDTL